MKNIAGPSIYGQQISKCLEWFNPKITCQASNESTTRELARMLPEGPPVRCRAWKARTKVGVMAIIGFQSLMSWICRCSSWILEMRPYACMTSSGSGCGHGLTKISCCHTTGFLLWESSDTTGSGGGSMLRTSVPMTSDPLPSVWEICMAKLLLIPLLMLAEKLKLDRVLLTVPCWRLPANMVASLVNWNPRIRLMKQSIDCTVSLETGMVSDRSVPSATCSRLQPYWILLLACVRRCTPPLPFIFLTPLPHYFWPFRMTAFKTWACTYCINILLTSFWSLFFSINYWWWLMTFMPCNLQVAETISLSFLDQISGWLHLSHAM